MSSPILFSSSAPQVRPPASAARDPRPWPLAVLMLAGLFAVYFALRPPQSPPPGPAQAGAAKAAIVVPALADAKPSIEQGVTLTFSQNGNTDTRPARLIALYVPAGTPPTPFLTPGPFTATFAGYINLRLRGEFKFSVAGRGKVVVRINGQKVLEAAGDDFAGPSSPLLKMEKGKNPIEVTYTAPAKGDAWIRLIRTSRDTPPEPVQPGVLSHDVSAPALRRGIRLREGRELLVNLRCGNCHALQVPQAGADRLRMPELEIDAPDLSTAGARLKQTWMAAWIANPKSLRADASMPRVLHGDAAKAADIAAYLAALGKPADAPVPEADDEKMTQGSQLFAALGCIGCHTKPDADDAEGKDGRIPLKNVNAKFQNGAIKAWLMNPREHYRSARMPDFHLTDYEADRLVAYLTKKAAGKVEGSDKGDPAKGKALFATAGCANCHTVKAGKPPAAGGTKTFAALLSSSDFSKGCMAGDDAGRGKAPDFALTVDQRGALAAFAAAGWSSLSNDVFPEYAERAIRHLQCTACHARDEVDDRWSLVSDEVSDLMPPEANADSDQPDDAAAGPRRFVPRDLEIRYAGDKIALSGDQTRPLLTWVGEKLQPEWTARFIDGRIKYKPRYWMRARMPAFAPHGQAIAQGLALEHGVPMAGKSFPPPNADLAMIGQKLISRDGGFSCITCHSVKDSKAVSPFEAPAPNLVHVHERLTHDFFIHWMRKPMQFQSGTKMPVYSEAGKTTLREILNGDADKQFDAIWNYILQGAKMTPPE